VFFPKTGLEQNAEFGLQKSLGLRISAMDNLKQLEISHSFTMTRLPKPIVQSPTKKISQIWL
jgi:hypothetical protein